MTPRGAQIARCLLVVLASVVGSKICAQTFSVSGTVVMDDGRPVKGVLIEALPSTEARGVRSAKTGEDGTFRIPFAEYGTYRFRASLTGLWMRSMTIEVRQSDHKLEYRNKGEFGPEQTLPEFDVQPGRVVELAFVLTATSPAERLGTPGAPPGAADLGEANRLTGEKKFAESDALLQKIVDAGRADAATWYLKGLNAVGSGRREEAAGLFSKAIAGDPKLPGAHAQLGLILFDQGDKAAAADRFRDELEISPQATPVAIDLAVALRDLGKRAESVAAWERVLGLAPREAGAYVELATLCTDMKDDAKVLDVLSRMQSVMKPDPSLWFNLGASFANDGKLDRAEFAFKKVLELDANYPEAHREMGWLKMRAGDPSAAGYFEAYLKLRPNAADADDVRAALRSMAARPAKHP